MTAPPASAARRPGPEAAAADPITALSRQCYWLGLDDDTPRSALAGDASADLVIVGGGFTGLWAAYLALAAEPGRDVVLLEGNAIGYGASGRCGGFAMTLVHRSLTTLAALVGDDGARRIHRAAARAVGELTRIVETEGIACDAEATGLVVVSNSAPQDRRIERELETAARLGLGGEFTALDRAAAQTRIHSERIRCGFAERHCTLVNPARLARGLKRAVGARGGRVFERTPVTGWDEDRTGVRIRTSGGTVRARQALVALNAYGATAAPTRAGVMTFYSYICLTRPLTPAEWAAVGWAGREGAEDRRDGLHYFRPTADGRVLWGGRDAPFRPGGPEARFDQDARQRRRLRETFEWFFPQLAAVPFEFHWGGPIGMTRDFLPVVGLFDDRSRRIAYAYGYNGHGVAIAYLAANGVLDLLAVRESEWTELAFVGRRPPYAGPIWLRNLITKTAAEAAYRADDEERRVVSPLWLRAADGLNRFLARRRGPSARA